MLVRYLMIAAAACLAVAGCQHKVKSRSVKTAQVGRPVAAQPQPLYLRGPVGQAPVQTVAYGASAPGSGSEPYRLDSGDRLRVVVFGQENLSRTYSVDGGGYISMPLIGGVKARGATTFELEERIAAQLRTKYVKDPKVTVEIQSYRPFFILGEVKRPGQYPYVYGMTVQTAVAIAGGFTERAREKKVKLTRSIGGRQVTTKVPDSYHIRPGDTIDVPERLF